MEEEKITIKFLKGRPGRNQYYRENKEYTLKKVVAEKYLNVGYAVRVR